VKHGKSKEHLVPNLIHLIYTSTATQAFTDNDILELLEKARENNQRLEITGMLLYTDGSFFQVLEGDRAVVDALFQHIAKDERHTAVTTIIRETIARRSFGDWTMGNTAISVQEVGDIVGLNDFFSEASCFSQLNSGRAKKLLSAFKEGRWRSKLSNTMVHRSSAAMKTALPNHLTCSFAFQPIIDASTQTIVSFEALMRGLNNEPASDLLQQVRADLREHFNENFRAIALGLATHLGLGCGLNLNLVPETVESLQASIDSTLEAAKRFQISPERMTLEIDEAELVVDRTEFPRTIEAYRGTGLKVAIDNFGSGHSGFALLDQYQPDMIVLNMNLIRNIESNGPRQAIFRGIAQTCLDLGVDIIAKGIETTAEYEWLRLEGIHLFQGNLFAQPTFEQLPPALFLEK
jgi:EAL domain-containing protein (putative c-di-GMP-specific phosphodiesterase class I)